VQYENWLDNTATIDQITVTSSSTTCTVGTPVPKILGTDVVFFVVNGNIGETATFTLTITDSFGNVKKDTIKFTVVAP